MSLKKVFLSSLSFLFICCATSNKVRVSKLDSNFWHHKDLILDSIPGLSLEKWYTENSSKKAKNDIIVAVLDSQIDLSHEDLQGQFWINKREIAYNGIDDDNNGYIDDINGWNFVGHKGNNFMRNSSIPKICKKIAMNIFGSKILNYLI